MSVGSPDPSSHPGANESALNPAKLAGLERYAEGGCAFSAPDAGGKNHGFAVQRKNLPFAVPAIRRDSITGRGNGHAVRMRVRRSHGSPVSIGCWLPNDFSSRELKSALESSRGARWASILTTLPRSKVIPDPAARQPLSREVRTFGDSVLAPSAPQSGALQNAKASGLLSADENCVWVDAVITIWDSEEGWVYLYVEIYVCEEPDPFGEVFAWVIDNGYGDYPRIVVDASDYEITVLDSVAFTAEVVSDTYMWIDRWRWAPAQGTAWDPWTKACPEVYQNDLYCRIQVHGTGAMYLEGEQFDGTRVSGWVRVVANLPPDVELSPDDAGDVEGPAGGNEVGNSGMLISDANRVSIAVAALNSGDWTYTQGCAQCGSGPYSEPAKNLANKYGDCTDYVYTMVKSVLDGYWNHEILRTFGFNSYNQTQLAWYGYQQITTLTAQVGDVVVRTKIGGSGHAGIFYGWAAGGHPIGIANNGIPATPDHPRQDKDTGRFDFYARGGYVTKFFRPQIP
jgi:hypothetical protein